MRKALLDSSAPDFHSLELLIPVKSRESRGATDSPPLTPWLLSLLHGLFHNEAGPLSMFDSSGLMFDLLPHLKFKSEVHLLDVFSGSHTVDTQSVSDEQNK